MFQKWHHLDLFDHYLFVKRQSYGYPYNYSGSLQEKLDDEFEESMSWDPGCWGYRHVIIHDYYRSGVKIKTKRHKVEAYKLCLEQAGPLLDPVDPTNYFRMSQIYGVTNTGSHYGTGYIGIDYVIDIKNPVFSDEYTYFPRQNNYQPTPYGVIGAKKFGYGADVVLVGHYNFTTAFPVIHSWQETISSDFYGPIEKTVNLCMRVRKGGVTWRDIIRSGYAFHEVISLGGKPKLYSVVGGFPEIMVFDRVRRIDFGAFSFAINILDYSDRRVLVHYPEFSLFDYYTEKTFEISFPEITTAMRIVYLMFYVKRVYADVSYFPEPEEYRLCSGSFLGSGIKNIMSKDNLYSRIRPT